MGSRVDSSIAYRLIFRAFDLPRSPSPAPTLRESLRANLRFAQHTQYAEWLATTNLKPFGKPTANMRRTALHSTSLRVRPAIYVFHPPGRDAAITTHP